MSRAPIGSRESHDLPHEVVRTSKGRVVYYRKRHGFRAADISRMARSIDEPLNILETIHMIAAVMTLLRLLLPRVSEFLGKRMEELRGNLQAAAEALGQAVTDGEEEPEDVAPPREPGLLERIFGPFFRGPIQP